MGTHKLLAAFTAFCCHIATFVSDHPFLSCLFSNAFLVPVDSGVAGYAVYLKPTTSTEHRKTTGQCSGEEQ